MVVRTTLSYAARQAQLTLSRATVREFDDGHLMQQVKKADVHHNESPSDFEHWQPGPITGVHLKQAEDQQQGQQGKQGQGSAGKGEQGDWNHNQPKGDAAEAVMLYLGSRSHAVALVDDRRVRPYGMKEGESAMYALSGTGQMLFHNNAGSYLVSVNNPAEQSKDSNDVDRYASVRHVNKKKQPREIKEGQKIDDPKHEGETVNTEMRCTKTRIEFYVGGNLCAYIEAGKFVTMIETRLGSENAQDPVYGKHQGVGKTTLPQGSGAVLVDAPKPGPPVSEDTAP